MAKVPEDVGCETQECKRSLIAREGKAREIKTFSGTHEKGCGKFIIIEK